MEINSVKEVTFTLDRWEAKGLALLLREVNFFEVFENADLDQTVLDEMYELYAELETFI